MSSSVGSVFGGITRKVNDLGASLSKLKRQSADIGRLQSAQSRLADAQSKGNAASVARYSAQIEKLSSSLREAGVDTSRLSQEQARLASQIGRTEGQLGRMTRLSGAWSGFKSNLLNVGDAFGRVKSNVTGLATKLGVLGTAAGYLFKTQFLDTAAEFEKLQTMLTSVEKGDVNKAKASFGWISTWATETPLQLAEATSAFIKFKNYGLDPTKGGLEALEDQNAKMGGGIHELEGLIMAVGQAWTKQKLQGEEIMQMQERGVPVWDLLSATMGKSVAELQDMSKAGKLGRKEIELLLKAIGQNSKGAAKAQMKTWGGMISNLQDWWSKFTVMVMSEGLFEWMKGKLDSILTQLDIWAKDGTLKQWAKDTGRSLQEFFTSAFELGKWLKDTIIQTKDFVGGWKRLGKVIAGLALAPLALSITNLGIEIGAFMLKLPGLRGALTRLGISVTAALGPWGLLAAAIAGAAIAIHENWGGIGDWWDENVGKHLEYSINQLKDKMVDLGLIKPPSWTTSVLPSVGVGSSIPEAIAKQNRFSAPSVLMPAKDMPAASVSKQATINQDIKMFIQGSNADDIANRAASKLKERDLYDAAAEFMRPQPSQ
jgi:tape measure domain-containing protein